MDSMILGRYIPGDSIIHRLDPRSKLLAMILLILIVFWANNPFTNLILDVASMENVQLGVPKITAFCKRLADRGVAFKKLPIKIEEFKESLNG